MGLYELMFGGGEKVEDDLEETQKGMGYGELILDNVIGLDNDYDSFGEKLGRTINEDEIGFMKQAGQGIYEGAKDFIKAPIETTKEAVKEVATSTKDLFTKSLDERLQEMYGVDMTSATGDQITAARESVMSDALGASALIPAAGVGIKGAKVLANAMPDLDTAAEYFKNIPMPEYDPNTLGMNLGNIKFNKSLKNGVGLRNYTLDDLSRLDAEVGDYSNIKSGRGVDGDAKLGVIPENGTVVALRPNLNTSIPNNPLNIPDNPKTGKKGETKLTTIHDGTNEKKVEGSVLGYVPYAVAENVSFVVNQNSRRQIASRIHGLDVADAKNKFPSMSVVGTFNGNRNLLEEGVELVELGINPAVNHLFVDMSTGQAVKGADAAMTIGDRVYAVGVKYYNREDAPKPQPASDGTELPNTVVYKYENAAEELDTETVPATVAEQTENMLDIDRRVDTRLPTSEKSPDFARMGEGELVSDGDAMFSANTNMAENFAMMAEYYPGMKNLWSDDVAETRANVTEQMTGNIVSLYDMSDRLGIAGESKQWYKGANRIALGLSGRFGVQDTKAAGVLAALSPQKNWFENVALAERLIKHHTELGPNAPWSQAMDDITTTVPPARKKQGNTSFQDGKNNTILESIKGKTWGELETPEQKGMWLRAYDEAHFGRQFREVSPEGDILGYYTKNDGTPALASHQGFSTLAKVVRILEGDGTLNSISPELGQEHKVRNFFNNILNPDSPKDVTVDTHQIAAGLFRPLGAGSVEVGQGLSGSNKKGNPAVFSSDGKATSGMGGTYGLYFDATTEGAKLRGVLPREMQSVSWEQLRTLFPDTLKRDKSFIAATEAIWRMVDDKQLDPEGARNLIIAEAEKRGQTEDKLIPSWKNYKGKRRDIGIATAGLMGAAGLATAEEAPVEEEGFATPQ